MRLDQFLARHPPGVDVTLLADGSLRIRARVGVKGSENVWRTCDTIERGRQRRPREENAHVHGLAEARRAPGRG